MSQNNVQQQERSQGCENTSQNNVQQQERSQECENTSQNNDLGRKVGNTLRGNLTWKFLLITRYVSSFYSYKPIGASPGRDYVVLTRMVLQIIQYDTLLHSVQNDTSKKGGMLHGLRIKKKSGILILRKPH